MTPQALMAGFAERTGLTGTRPQRRYLWTDAFAVCNFIGLGQLDRAAALVDSVHRILGVSRDAAHPTLGGVRIGKPLPERGADEPFDEELEWDRDGQYFHYLTKWQHALDQLARASGGPRLSLWARELAATAHRHFAFGLRGSRALYWKMSVDLTRPLVSTMGYHDPLDGYITCLELEATAREHAWPGPALGDSTADYRRMIDPRALATSDPLGLGGLLADASRLSQLGGDHPLLETLVDAIRVSLVHVGERGVLRAPAHRRLAFRELGLAIGLAAAPSLSLPDEEGLARLRDAINAFWLDDDHRATTTYSEHEDINDVMLATSLAPSGFLQLAT